MQKIAAEEGGRECRSENSTLNKAERTCKVRDTGSEKKKGISRAAYGGSLQERGLKRE